MFCCTDQKEKLIVLDLHKIKHKLYDRFSTVYQQVCNDVDRVHLADHDNAEKKPDDNNVTGNCYLTNQLI